PFNPETTITYKIQQAEKVRLEIMDLLGRQVAVLVDEFMPAGRHIVKWNGKNDRGVWMHSGIYVVRLRVPGKVISRKITLLK
ncbi:MAG: T9SS C-terminal target domain-containing protein, partial [Calditrichaeota bacterium]